MILVTSGHISRYFAETLVLLFFPGAKFPKEGDDAGIRVELTVTEDDTQVCGYASIDTPEGNYTASYVVPPDTAAHLSREMQCKTAGRGRHASRWQTVQRRHASLGNAYRSSPSKHGNGYAGSGNFS